ncbi:uncharacterized protein LOC115738567 [Rhodamnia argentea]|uniref:Uncharacterized protein LOC115738567 n=1 Tax=Rhodamnia argentea TaxID=178133 RepID=A0A8B8NWZ0_9MYRT|nr:uncharacterized protein LOC115738567 [Rhodamnia argentea]
MLLKRPLGIAMQFARWIADLDWRFILLVLPPLSLLLFLSISSPANPFSNLAPLRSILLNRTLPRGAVPAAANLSAAPSAPAVAPRPWKDELDRSRIAVCLVGGARRFELTGPSIVERILKVYPNSDLFLHSPFDENAFKFLLLKSAPRIAGVRIFRPEPMAESAPELRVLTASNSPNGIQGLLQYFNLVEGCLTMIKSHQARHNFTYDWIVRTRVDGFWNAPLDPDNFIPGHYVIPPGSTYGGLNDRLGIGDLPTSTIALSRLSLIPQLDQAGFRQLNSETAFRAQLNTQNVTHLTKRLPFCIVSDRQYAFPPSRYGVPVATILSKGPLSGAKCRPCTPVCRGACVGRVMPVLDKGWSWTQWENGTLELCDAHGEWETGWEKIFDRVAGKALAKQRKGVWRLKVKDCVSEFEKMKRRTVSWEAPAADEMCKVGLGYAR